MNNEENNANILDSETLQSIEQNKKISLIIYYLTDKKEKKIHHILEKILTKFNKEQYLSTLYTAAKELAINGVKANMKNVFFKEKNLELENPEDYKIGIKKYKEAFSEKMAQEYGSKCEEQGLFVKITFIYSETGIRLEILNNTLITEVDERRMREKLAKAMQYEDIAQFYMEQADETEGAGMGIALIVMLLKGEGIDASNFRVGIVDRITTARIEVPFTEDFVPYRKSHNPN